MDTYADRPRDASGRIGPKLGVEFSPPEGLELKGSKGTASVTWRRGANGKVCITGFNGVSLSDGNGMRPKDDEESEPAPGDNEMAEGEMMG